MDTKNIEFPIGAKRAAELLNVNHRTLKYWCREIGILMVGNSYCIFSRDFDILKIKADEYHTHQKYLSSVK
jgi:hypothetical protein